MKHKLRLTSIFYFNLFFAISIAAQSVVATHGRLQVEGNRIMDSSSNIVSLAGNSLFWSNAGDSADYYNAETVNFLADDWNTTIIRCAMGVNEPWDGGRGYINSPMEQETKIRRVIDAAIAKGIYVIIDWHTHEAEIYEEEAIAFFTKMARIYGDEPNIIYEIYNEPINQSWPTIKNYAEAVIAGIRSEDPDNLIIVGTPFYSQEVDVASTNPINDNNTAYTLHFYAGTHGNELRNKATTAMNNGIALFVTEWGSVNADGAGNPNVQGTEAWMQFLEENDLSHANWAVSDKPEGASIVQNGAGLSGLTNNELTEAGNLLLDIIQNWNSEPSDAPINEPGTINCNSIDCIRNAMASAQPGDEIIVASGTYTMTNKIDGAFGRNSYLYASTNGTQNNPITLRGADPANPPIIRGIDYLDGYLMSVDGDFWIFRDMEFRTGSKGIMLDNANHVQIMDVTVHDVGDEAIHFRDGSSNNLVDGCTIFNTGNRVAGFGEGIYVGSDRGQHDQYNPSCDNNTIQNSVIGPNIAAEGADIKEGTENTIIRNCIFSAQGISGENSADAFIDLKGAYGFIYNNTFNLDGSTVLSSGIDFLDRGTDFNTGFRNAIFNNTFNLGNRAQEIPTARRQQGSPTETHVWDNIRIPASDDFPISNGTLNYVSQFCPDWNILPCSGNMNQRPLVRFVTPAGNRIIDEGYSSFLIEADASDADGTVSGVALYRDGVLIRNNVMAPYAWGSGNNQAETLGLTAGTYTFEVVTTDNEGATANDTFVLTVTDVETPNQAPTVSFTTSISDMMLEEGYEVLELIATAWDEDGTIANLSLFVNDVLIRTDATAPYEWGLGNNRSETLGLAAGTHTIRAVATDNEGATVEVVSTLTVQASPEMVDESLVGITMYPNPTTDEFFIDGLPDERGIIQILDMTGRVVFSSILADKTKPIDISQLSASTYIVSITYDNLEIIKKLVID